MKRLDRIREALKQLSPQRADSTLPTFHPRISLHKLKELVECLFYVFFPECTNPPSMTPTFADVDALMEWVIGHIADILTTQIYVAFVLHGDAHAVEDTKPFKSLNTSRRTQLEWNGQRSATLSLLERESTGTQGGYGVAAAAEKDVPKAAPEVLRCTGNRARLPSSVEVSSKSAASNANAICETADVNSGANQVFLTNCKRRADAIVTKFVVERLAHVRWLLHTDVEAIFKGDVAASSLTEVVLCYPGLRCMVHQRVAHQLHLLGVPQNLTRMLTELAHSETGIDIHPNTVIGHHFFIDHGTGIVIGATAVIGNGVSIYQGVTLGARSFPTNEKTGERIRDLPRHPIIEDGVTLYANAVVLGRVTIGERSTIGGNCWIVRDVPPFSTVVQRSNHVLQPHERVFLEKDGSGI